MSTWELITAILGLILTLLKLYLERKEEGNDDALDTEEFDRALSRGSVRTLSRLFWRMRAPRRGDPGESDDKTASERQL